MITFKSVCNYTIAVILLSGIAFGTATQAQQTAVVKDFTPIVLYQYDAKTYPGVSCEAQAVAEIDAFSNLEFDMFNANPDSRSVVCPIVRDNTKNTNGTVGVYVNIYNVANSKLECALYSADKFGLVIASDINSTSNSGNQTIYLDVDSSVDRGFYGINCTLEEGAAIRSYEVREYLETDKDNNFLIRQP